MISSKRKTLTVTNFSHLSGKLHKNTSKISVLAPTLGHMQETHTSDGLMCSLCPHCFCSQVYLHGLCHQLHHKECHPGPRSHHPRAPADGLVSSSLDPAQKKKKIVSDYHKPIGKCYSNIQSASQPYKFLTSNTYLGHISVNECKLRFNAQVLFLNCLRLDMQSSLFYQLCMSHNPIIDTQDSDIFQILLHVTFPIFLP